MGVVLATCQVLGMPAEQERHAYFVPFFPLGSVFLPSARSVLQLDGWPLSRKYCLGFGIEFQTDPHRSGLSLKVCLHREYRRASASPEKPHAS